MAKAPVFLLLSASTLVLLLLMVLAGPGRGRESEGRDTKPKAASISQLQHQQQQVGVSASDHEQNAESDHEVPEHVEFMPVVHVGVAVGQPEVPVEVKVSAAQCSQSNGNLLSLLLPCAGAVRDPRPFPSSACCQGVHAVTDGCVCYLETFIDGNPFGLTLDDVLRIATYCGRNTVKC